MSDRKLRELALIEYGKSPNGFREEKTSIPIYGTGGVIGFAKSSLFNDPLVVVARKGSLGKPYFTSLPCWVIDTAYAVKPYDGVNAKWLYYSLDNFDLESLNEATGVPSISRDYLYRVKINTPSLPEQKKIARILTTVDNLIEKTQALIEKYKAIKQGMMNDLFTRGVDENGKLRPPYEEAPHLYKESELGWIPKEWSVFIVEQLINERPKNGYSPKESDVWSGVYMLGLGCLTFEGFKPLQIKYAPIEDPKLETARVFDGDILVSRSNTRELVAITVMYKDIGFPCVYSDLMMKIKPNDKVNSRFFELLLMSSRVRRQLTNASCGTSGSMMKINSYILLNCSTAIPSTKEQLDILNALKPITGLLEQEYSYLEKIKLIKKGLMQNLLTGKVRVNVGETLESNKPAELDLGGVGV